MEEKVRIGVNFNDYALLKYCWSCANGNRIQAKKLYDWVQAAETEEEKAVRTVALQDCPCGNPIEFYNWIAPNAKTWRY